MATVIKEEDNVSPVETIIHLDDGNLAIERKQDAQPVLDEIKEIKDHTNGISKTGDLYHVGRIPAILVEKYCNDKGITFRDFLLDDTHVTRIMNDTAYKHLRIWQGVA